MRRMELLAHHVDEHRLAEAAEGGPESGLTDAEERHLAACERCGLLFDGHRRALHLLSSPWQRVDTLRMPVPFWRRGKVARWAELAAAVAIAVALTAALLYWRQAGPQTIGTTASPSGPRTPVPTASSSPHPTATPFASTTPWSGLPLASSLLDVPAAMRTNVPLPAGGQVDTSRLVADGDWLVMGVSFPDAPTSEAIYAANLHTGALRKIRDASPFNSVPTAITVAGSQAAWADVTCKSSWPSPMPTEQAHPQPIVKCSSWRVVLVDLDTGSSRVVAQARDPEVVNVQDAPVPVVPTVAIGDGQLAYTTGDLAHGIVLNLLTLSSGATRTLPLGGPLEQMSWAGGDLAWVEDADLHAAGTSPGGYNTPYYLGSQVMLLPADASQPQPIADGGYALAVDAGKLAWAVGGCEMWTASAPSWQPAPTGYEGCPVFVSGGWLAWTGAFRNASLAVLGPADSEPRGVPDGLALTGGWLVLGTGYLVSPTKLEVVRISDLK
jgi:hypothetical protein